MLIVFSRKSRSRSTAKRPSALIGAEHRLQIGEFMRKSVLAQQAASALDREASDSPSSCTPIEAAETSSRSSGSSGLIDMQPVNKSGAEADSNVKRGSTREGLPRTASLPSSRPGSRCLGKSLGLSAASSSFAKAASTAQPAWPWRLSSNRSTVAAAHRHPVRDRGAARAIRVPLGTVTQGHRLLSKAISVPALVTDLQDLCDDYYGGDGMLLHEDVLNASNPRLFPLRPVQQPTVFPLHHLEDIQDVPRTPVRTNHWTPW